MSVVKSKADQQPKQANRRQVEKRKLRDEHGDLKKLYTLCADEEKECLKVLMDEIRAKILAITRVKANRREKSR